VEAAGNRGVRHRLRGAIADVTLCQRIGRPGPLTVVAGRELQLPPGGALDRPETKNASKSAGSITATCAARP